MNILSSNSGSWLGTLLTIFLILCGIISSSFSRTGQLMVSNPIFRVSMIILIMMAKFYNDVVAVALTVVLLTVLFVYSKQSDIANHVQYHQLDPTEYKQYLEELTLISNSK